MRYNSFLNNTILDGSKLKAFADGKINLAQIKIYQLDRVENLVGKGENACCQHFLLFPQCFQMISMITFQGSLKLVIV